MQYWQNNVIQNFLPPIDYKKKIEVEARKMENDPKSASFRNPMSQLKTANFNRGSSACSESVNERDPNENLFQLNGADNRPMSSCDMIPQHNQTMSNSIVDFGLPTQPKQ